MQTSNNIEYLGSTVSYSHEEEKQTSPNYMECIGSTDLSSLEEEKETLNNIESIRSHEEQKQSVLIESMLTYPERRSVQFKDIEIREYNVTIGDNPACRKGCPVSIGWDVQNVTSIPVHSYEDSRPPRRDRCQLQIPHDIREEMLKMEWEIPNSFIRQAEAEVGKVRKQRLETACKSQRAFRRSYFLKRLWSMKICSLFSEGVVKN